MFLRAADRDGGCAQRVDSLGEQRTEPVAEPGIRLERQVRAVLLARSEWHHDAVAAAGKRIADIAPRHGGKPPR
jgi:hypothetical protein